MQGVDTETTLKNLIYMYKGSQTCSNQTSDLKICRATPAGQADPERCESKASDFFHCYHSMVQGSKTNCVD